MLSMTCMAGVTGLEPAASGVTGRRSNQLSYTPKKGPTNCVCNTVFPAYNPKNAFEAIRDKKIVTTATGFALCRINNQN